MTTEPHRDWELFQYDSDSATSYVRRLAVPGGWLYQVSFTSDPNGFQAPVFVPDSQVHAAEIEHYKREIARLDVELAKERGGHGTVARLRIENDRMKPVYEAAKAYMHAPSGCWQAENALAEAVALAAIETIEYEPQIARAA